MASKQPGGAGYECLPPGRLPEPQLSLQSCCGFLSGGRSGATLDDREDCFGRATVALTRAIQHTYIVSPVDMAGLIGMAQTLAVFHSGYHTLFSPLLRPISL